MVPPSSSSFSPSPTSVGFAAPVLMGLSVTFEFKFTDESKSGDTVLWSLKIGRWTVRRRRSEREMAIKISTPIFVDYGWTKNSIKTITTMVMVRREKDAIKSEGGNFERLARRSGKQSGFITWAQKECSSRVSDAVQVAVSVVHSNYVVKWCRREIEKERVRMREERKEGNGG